MRYTVILISILFYSLVTVAQIKQIDRSREIHIGQGLPNLPSLPIINYNADFIELSAMSDKVIILDFFDTFCASCIEAMPRLAKVKAELGDFVEIIPVTWQPHTVIERFYKSNKYLKEHNVLLPTIVGDTLLKKYFPHQSISHTVWLYKGKVRAISHPDFVTVDQIRELIATGRVDVPVKDDFRPKQSFDEVSADGLRKGGKVISQVVLSGYQDGIDSESVRFKKDSLDNTYLSTFVNMDLLGATTSAWAHIKEPKYLVKKERIVWDVPDSSIFYHDKDRNVQPRQIWNLNHLLSYRRVDTLERTDAERAMMVLKDLSNLLQVRSKWEYRQQRCLVIKKVVDQVTNVGSEGNIYRGSEMLAFLMDYSGKYLPVIDEANYKGDIHIPKFTTIEELNEGLARYGLVVQEEVRAIEKLVFEQK